MGNLYQCLIGAPKLQQKTVTPSNSVQTVTPDSGYDGLSKVTVNKLNANLYTITKEVNINTYGGNVEFDFSDFTELIGVTDYHLIRQNYWNMMDTADITINKANKKVIVTVVENGFVGFHATVTAIGI